MKTEITVGPESSLQDILDMLPPGATVRLRPGVYRQKLQIRTPGLTLIGAGAEETKLVYDDYAKKLHPDGREYNTFRTWTLAVCADKVTLRQLTVENDALSPREKGQEVALSVYGDDFLMEDCLLRSTQETLFVGPLPQDLIRRYVDLLPPELRADRLLSQRFLRCRIEGSVDFIFGCGRTLFQGCEIRFVFDGRERRLRCRSRPRFGAEGGLPLSKLRLHPGRGRCRRQHLPGPSLAGLRLGRL